MLHKGIFYGELFCIKCQEKLLFSKITTFLDIYHVVWWIQSQKLQQCILLKELYISIKLYSVTTERAVI
jgi:hypothetical protein